jgi:hypothetical protein
MKFKDASHFSPSPRLTLFHIAPWRSGQKSRNVCHGCTWAVKRVEEPFFSVFLHLISFLLCSVSWMLEICFWAGDLNYCTHFMCLQNRPYFDIILRTIYLFVVLFAGERRKTQIVLKQRGKSHAIYFILLRFYCLNLLSRLTFVKAAVIVRYMVWNKNLLSR